MMNATCFATIDLSNFTSLFLSSYLPYEWVFSDLIRPCIVLIGFTGNMSFIWTVIKVSTMHTATYIYLASLAFSDIFMLIGLGIDDALDTFNSPLRFDTLLVTIPNLITSFSFYWSLSLVTLVSLERYLAICHPIKHRVLKGTKRALKMIAITTLFNISIFCTIGFPFIKSSFIICYKWPSDDRFNDHPRRVLAPVLTTSMKQLYDQITNIVYVIVYFACLLTNSYMYAQILLTLKRRQQNRSLHISSEFEQNIRQIATMVIANGLAFFLISAVVGLHFLYTLLDLFEINFFDAYQVSVFVQVRSCLLALNTSVNPMIYFIANRRYRRALKMSVMRPVCKNGNKRAEQISMRAGNVYGQRDLFSSS